MKILAVLISILFVVLAILHVFVDSITIDAIAIVLLVLASLPWLFPYLKSLEFPGGVKIELKDVKEAVAKVSQGDEAAPSESDEYDFLQIIAAHDPNLALVAVRIEIEKAVRNAIGDGERKPMPLSRGIQKLTESGVLSHSVANGLRDFIQLGNQAAHGVEVEAQAVKYIIDNAGKILNPFKEQLANAA
ncbi:DUF4145 domain-containing protein [Vibrio ostreae]|uniref:DUF4145 domain-containing protein n=1 Tax=Vibrio ostreae TaxID=2841925 RepID=A0A975U9W4_9VIBR|nr:DUF4145 domain-containing protein [Vibrio ostreae]QXO17006.1 DUF4145 domain-containing protein [Vibrio ostreae]